MQPSTSTCLSPFDRIPPRWRFTPVDSYPIASTLLRARRSFKSSCQSTLELALRTRIDSASAQLADDLQHADQGGGAADGIRSSAGALTTVCCKPRTQASWSRDTSGAEYSLE